MQVSGLWGRKPKRTAKSWCWTKARHALWALEGFNSLLVWKSGTSFWHAAPPDLLIESNTAFHMPCWLLVEGAPKTLLSPPESTRTTPTFKVFCGPEHPPTGPAAAGPAAPPVPPAPPEPAPADPVEPAAAAPDVVAVPV